jgi:cytoskeletal protein CcmA (bactofilin family)
MNKEAMRPADRAPSRLGSSLHVKGEISGNEDLVIDGTVEGRVHINERKLTVGATAKLTADVIAGEVIVHGSVKGNVRGKDKIIEDGAYFKGSIEIEKSAEKESDKNALSRTVAASGAPAAGAGSRSI